VVILNLEDPTVHEESAWSLPRDKYRSFAALSCGGKGTVLLQIVDTAAKLLRLHWHKAYGTCEPEPQC